MIQAERLIDPLEVETIGVIRGLNKVVVQTLPGEIVIDQDFAPENIAPMEFKTIDEASQAVLALRDEIDGTTRNPELFDQRLQALGMHASVLAGQTVERTVYTQTLMGAQPHPMTDAAIAKQKRRMAAAQKLREEQAWQPKNDEEFQQEFHIDAAYGRAQLARYFKLPPKRRPLNLQVGYIDDLAADAFTQTNAKGELDEKVNSKYVRSRAQLSRTTAHEDTGHVNHFNILDNQVAAGNINESFGLITTVTPEMRQIEIIARLNEKLWLPAAALENYEILAADLAAMVVHQAFYNITNGQSEQEALTVIEDSIDNDVNREWASSYAKWALGTAGLYAYFATFFDSQVIGYEIADRFKKDKSGNFVDDARVGRALDDLYHTLKSPQELQAAIDNY